MELIFLASRVVYWLFIAPVWWVATYLASYFYPYEGDNRSFGLSLIFALVIGAVIAWMVWYFW